MNITQYIIGCSWMQIIKTGFVGRPFGHNTEPLFIHVVFSFNIVAFITPVCPGCIWIVYIKINGLPGFPPTIGKLESKTANRVFCFPKSCCVLIYFFPIEHVIAGLAKLVFLIGLCIVSVGTKLGEEYGLSIFIFNTVIQISK